MTVSVDMKRLGITVTREDDEVLQAMADAMGTSKSALMRDILHEFCEMIGQALEANKETPDKALRTLVRNGMSRVGEALSELIGD